MVMAQQKNIKLLPFEMEPNGTGEKYEDDT